MDKTSQAYEQILRKFVSWAQEREDIRLAFVLGSRARTDHPADEWADLDLAVFATDIRPYIDRADWLDHLGKACLTFIESTGDGRSKERRVLFEGGLDVDFAMLPMESFQQVMRSGADPGLADIFHRGVRIVLDKDGLVADPAMFAAAWQPPAPPGQEEFLQTVNDFWYHAVWTAKHLRRGELWWAKSGCDDHLKSLLRRMLEWHARAMQGPGHDTWLRGRFLEEWADRRAVKALRKAFARYDAADLWRALAATMDLFHWVSQETAQKFHFPLPADGIEYAAGLVRHLSPRAKG